MASELEQAVEEAEQLFSKLTDYQREEVFLALKSSWCEHCGRRQPEYFRCQCWNDE